MLLEDTRQKMPGPSALVLVGFVHTKHCEG